MVLLSDILRSVSSIRKQGNLKIDIGNICYDSRKVSPGDLFVAIKGGKLDGHDHIDAAIRKGAAAVMGEKSINGISSVPYIQVGNSRIALAETASAYYGNPSDSLSLIGVTGTNGKTSTVYLIDSILKENGEKTGMLGTVIYKVGEQKTEALWTTPESLTMHQYFYSMVQENIQKVTMELSSHSLEQHRAEGLNFRLGVFTNLSQDHLDYHRSMAEYAAAKQRLFKQLDPVLGENIINGDDPESRGMTEQNRRPVFTYSAESGKADVFPEKADFSFDGIISELQTPAGKINIESSLIGRHNLYNIMAAVTAGIALKIPVDIIKKGIRNFKIVPGRLEPVNAGQPFPVLVDYAHTDDAIKKVLDSVKKIIAGKLIAVFGCGGDRDRAKRQLMGKAAESGSDIAILTSDNPRTEDPEQIINDTLEGVSDKTKMEVYVDRTEAIRRAIDLADKDDCVLILGKGHETYQDIKGVKHPYDDRIVAKKYLSGKNCD
ncbi:UDP-N-acetylmuramoyl-L-alanyl-D-glutamate--2,6-diaminopimelate ligase [candidate division KSB1 bacterium]